MNPRRQLQHFPRRRLDGGFPPRRGSPQTPHGPDNITLALAAGMPLELLQRVTGHRTVAVVLKHHFRPGREDFRQTLLKRMPRILADRQRGSVTLEIHEIHNSKTTKTLKRDKERLRRLLTSAC